MLCSAAKEYIYQCLLSKKGVTKTFILLIVAFVCQVVRPRQHNLTNIYQRSSHFNTRCSTTKLRMVYLFGSANMPVLIGKGTRLSANNFLLTHVGIIIKNPFMQPTLQIGVCTEPFQFSTVSKKIMIRPDSGCTQVHFAHHGEKPNQPNTSVTSIVEHAGTFQYYEAVDHLNQLSFE